MAACPDCGVERKNLQNHRGSGVCRSNQIVRDMEARGFKMLNTLKYARILKWADLPYERIPAYARSKYKNPKGWKAAYRKRLLFKDDTEFAGPLYEGLGDALFVEEWLWLVFRHPKAPDPGFHKKVAYVPFIKLLQYIHRRDTDLKQALIVANALNGPAAVADLLEDLFDEMEMEELCLGN